MYSWYTAEVDCHQKSPFFAFKALRNRNTGEIIIDTKRRYTHSDLAKYNGWNKDFWSNKIEKGFIGWDDKFYSTNDLDIKIHDYINSYSWPPEDERVNFSRLKSSLARFRD